MSAKRKGRGKGPKGKATRNEALGPRTNSLSVQNVIREPEVNTPQNPDLTTNPTIMDHDEARSTIELQNRKQNLKFKVRALI